jgi:hypothetical protein
MNHLMELQKYFSYKLEQPGNADPHVCTIWNGYGLSVSAESYSAEKAIELTIAEAKKGVWK